MTLSPINSCDEPEEGSTAKVRRAPTSGFTLLELVMVIALIAVVAAMLIPFAGRMRSKADQLACSTNLRHIAAGFQLYAQDHGGQFPEFKATGGGDVMSWREKIYDYVINPDTNRSKYYVWYCPAKEESEEKWRNVGSYGSNLNLSNRRISTIEDPAQMMMAIDTTLKQGHHAKSENSGVSRVEEWVHFRHLEKANMVMVDGHVEVVELEDVRDRVMPAFNP
tara:strand:+ start:24 stop:689 length:666 start_codon:yes stop_codon:yes gene_type:complete